MKRNVKLRTSLADGSDYMEYEDDTVSVSCYKDGSGHLKVKNIGFVTEEGTHKDRVSKLKHKARIIAKALKVLEQLEDPKLYINGTYTSKRL